MYKWVRPPTGVSWNLRRDSLPSDQPEGMIANAQTPVWDADARVPRAMASLVGASWNSVLNWFRSLRTLQDALEGTSG